MYASTQRSRVFILWCTRCLIRPSADFSHGMSSALTTLGSCSYILRNAVEAATSSARMLAVLCPTWAKSCSSRILLMSVSELFEHHAVRHSCRVGKGAERAVPTRTSAVGTLRFAHPTIRYGPRTHHKSFGGRKSSWPGDASLGG